MMCEIKILLYDAVRLRFIIDGSNIDIFCTH